MSLGWTPEPRPGGTWTPEATPPGAWAPAARSYDNWLVEVIGHTPRITDDLGYTRITEQGNVRIIEFFAVTWLNEKPTFTVWLPATATAFDDNAFDPNAFE